MYCPVREYIYEDNTNTCSKFWEILTNMRYGAPSEFGKIYQACCKNNCNYIAKIIPISEISSFEDIEKEISIQTFVYKSSPDITIPIIQAYRCRDKNEVIIIMPRLYATFKERLMGDISNIEMLDILRRIYHVVKYLHDIGYVHDDLHVNNIMFEENDTIKLIDFGKSFYTTDQTELQRDFVRLGLSIDNIMDNPILLASKLTQLQKLK